MTSLIDFAIAGGPVIWILIALSVLSLILIFVKIFDLWLSTSGSRQRTQALNVLKSSGLRAARDVPVFPGSPANRLLLLALREDPNSTPANVLEAELERTGNYEVIRMNRFMRVLEMIAMVGPLLGLLGTVLGMIEAFQQLELEGGAANAAVLAGGIWKALLTTAAGLIVAIPAAIAASLFAARVEIATHQMEDTIKQFLATRRGAKASGS